MRSTTRPVGVGVGRGSCHRRVRWHRDNEYFRGSIGGGIGRHRTSHWLSRPSRLARVHAVAGVFDHRDERCRDQGGTREGDRPLVEGHDDEQLCRAGRGHVLGLDRRRLLRAAPDDLAALEVLRRAGHRSAPQQRERPARDDVQLADPRPRRQRHQLARGPQGQEVRFSTRLIIRFVYPSLTLRRRPGRAKTFFSHLSSPAATRRPRSSSTTSRSTVPRRSSTLGTRSSQRTPTSRPRRRSSRPRGRSRTTGSRSARASRTTSPRRSSTGSVTTRSPMTARKSSWRSSRGTEWCRSVPTSTTR